jgi:hypothetical protein
LRSYLLGLIKGRTFSSIHIALPCQTFSRARRGKPPPLRSNLFPMGLPGLSASDSLKVRESNVLLHLVVKILKIAQLLHIPCILENPQSSLLWQTPAIKRFLQQSNVAFETCEFCMFGVPWRKSTSFLGIHVGLASLRPFRCLHKPRGVCKRTLLPHVVLTGKDPDAPHQFMTYTAQAYPRKLCALLAEVFKNAVMNQRLLHFAGLF